jgi:hypothetical protein
MGFILGIDEGGWDHRTLFSIGFFLFSLMKRFITQMHDLVAVVLELLLMFLILVYNKFGSSVVTYI